MLDTVREKYDCVRIVQVAWILWPAVVVDIYVQTLDVGRSVQTLLEELRILVPLVIALAVAGLPGDKSNRLRCVLSGSAKRKETQNHAR